MLTFQASIYYLCLHIFLIGSSKHAAGRPE
jgi:hypothetical protein